MNNSFELGKFKGKDRSLSLLVDKYDYESLPISKVRIHGIVWWNGNKWQTWDMPTGVEVLVLPIWYYIQEITKEMTKEESK